MDPVSKTLCLICNTDRFDTVIVYAPRAIGCLRREVNKRKGDVATDLPNEYDRLAADSVLELLNSDHHPSP